MHTTVVSRLYFCVVHQLVVHFFARTARTGSQYQVEEGSNWAVLDCGKEEELQCSKPKWSTR
eukprot:28671-Eustigmatos_ZCMA.PRE.1